MSALMEPDDGRRNGTRDGLNVITRGRFRYTSFPVRTDDAGLIAVVALEAYDTETGARDFVIVAPGDVAGCACADCAPHEQDGPIPMEYVSLLIRTVQQRTRCAGITRGGPRCEVMTGHPSGFCGHHKRQRRDGTA